MSEKYRVSREEQDRYAVESHRSAAHATREGWFAKEMLPISIPQKKGDPIVVDRDESIREDTTAETLSKLKPAFKKDGTVTAGNAPGVNDGASATVVMAADVAARLNLSPLARIVGQATSGLEPMLVLMTPVEAVRKVLKKTGWTLDDVDLVRVERGVRGAGRRGHPRTRPRSGEGQRAGRRGRARPRDRLERRARPDDAALRAERLGKKRGIATLCLGGGNGVALAVERLWITTVGVIGAGTMGNGIAQVFAQSGFEVRLHDAAPAAIDRARASIEKSLAKFVEKGKLTAADRDATLGRLALGARARRARRRRLRRRSDRREPRRQARSSSAGSTR